MSIHEQPFLHANKIHFKQSIGINAIGVAIMTQSCKVWPIDYSTHNNTMKFKFPNITHIFLKQVQVMNKNKGCQEVLAKV